jgi:hypothetical protein
MIQGPRLTALVLAQSFSSALQWLPGPTTGEQVREVLA